MAKAKISYHGMIRRIVGKQEEIVDFSQGISLLELLDSLGKRYGEEFKRRVRNEGSSAIIGDLIIAVDGGAVDNLDILLKGDKEIDIAVIPQMEGGNERCRGSGVSSY